MNYHLALRGVLAEPPTDLSVKQHRDEAFVLRTQALGEADLIVRLFSRNFGVVHGVARSARRSRVRFGGLLEPLTRVQCSWTEKPGRELHRVDGVEGLRSFADMQSDPALQAACAVLAELTEAFGRDGEPDAKCFDLLASVLEALERGGHPFVLVRYFEHWLLRLHGLLPDLFACGVCDKLPPPAASIWIEPGGGVRCAACRAGAPTGTRRLNGPEREFLRLVRVSAPGAMPADPALARPGGALESVLRGTLESFAERSFRSYRHLAAALGTAYGSPEP